MIRKTSTLTTLGGIISGVGTGLVGIPITVTTYYAQIVKMACLTGSAYSPYP